MEKRRIIWSISRTFLLRYWGKNYPRDEFIQDVEQAKTHDMYFDLITICQRINNYSQDFERNQNVKDETEERRLKRCLDSHQVVSYSDLKASVADLYRNTHFSLTSSPSTTLLVRRYPFLPTYRSPFSMPCRFMFSDLHLKGLDPQTIQTSTTR